MLENALAIEIETGRGWLLGRMRIDKPDGVAAALVSAEQVWLALLSEFDPLQRPPMPAERIAAILDPMRSMGFFEIMNQTLRELPERPDTAALMAQFDAIGVGPHSQFNQYTLSPAVKRGLERAMRDGRAMIEAATQLTKAPDTGPYGYDYLRRAATGIERTD